MKTGLRVGTIVAVLSGVAALAPAAASAAVTCDYTAATHTVTAANTADFEHISFRVLPGGQIGVGAGESGAVTHAQCDGAATTANTDTIEYDDNSPGSGNHVEIDLRGGDFGPGFTPEPLFNASEIEFRIDVAGGSSNWITTWGDDTAGDGISMGTGGITLNAFSEDGLLSTADVDVTNAAGTAFPANGTGLVRVFTGGGNDAIKADGSDDTGSVSGADKVFNGGEGNDTLIGGTGDQDNFAPGPGDDVVDGNGGTGNFMAMGQFNLTGVTVDLAITAPQNTVGAGIDTISEIEHIQGTDQPDVLGGNAGVNKLEGLGGADVIRGAGGDDELFGSLDGPNPPHQGDTIAYDGIAAAGGQSVDLDANSSSGGQGTDEIGGFDHIIGSDYADPVLRGTTLANRITGGPGDDNVFALAGADTLLIRDGGHDTADCGADSDPDTVEADAPGVDTLIACLAPDVINFLPGPTLAAKKKCKKGFRLKKIKTKSGKKKKKCVRKRKKRKR